MNGEELEGRLTKPELFELVLRLQLGTSINCVM